MSLLTSLHHYNSDIRESTLTILAQMWLRKYAIKTYFFPRSPNYYFCSTWWNADTQKASFHSNAVLLHRQTSTSRWFNLFGLVTYKLQLIFMLLYDSLNLVVSGVILWAVTEPEIRRKQVESFALQQLDYVERKMHWCTVLLKDKIVINCALIASNILLT